MESVSPSLIVAHMRIGDLKQFVDKTVIFDLTSGETAKVKVTLVDEESEDVIGAVVESSSPEDYRGACAMHTFGAEEIVSAKLVE